MTRDGGTTATKPLSISNNFTSFARMPDGALIVSGMTFLQGLGRSGAGVSHDDRRRPGEPRRPGVLRWRSAMVPLRAADNLADGFALRSATRRPGTVVRFDQIRRSSPPAHEPPVPGELPALAGKGFGSPQDLGGDGLTGPTTDEGTTPAAGPAHPGAAAPSSPIGRLRISF